MLRFAYGFLNSISMLACGIAPFVYTALLSFLPKTYVWIVLAMSFVLLLIAEAVNQIRRHQQLKALSSQGPPPAGNGPKETDKLLPKKVTSLSFLLLADVRP